MVWEVEGAPSVFCFADEFGRAFYAFHRPATAHERPHAEETAYWFFLGSYVFTWRRTGNVDVWLGGDRHFIVSTNGIRLRLATRLF